MRGPRGGLGTDPLWAAASMRQTVPFLSDAAGGQLLPATPAALTPVLGCALTSRIITSEPVQSLYSSHGDTEGLTGKSQLPWGKGFLKPRRPPWRADADQAAHRALCSRSASGS